jgi:rhamnogalacturonyl hydrolase YesR
MLANGLMRWQDERSGLWFHVLDKANQEGNL